MKEENKIIWEGDYIALFDDGTITVSDGVGYLGEETNFRGLKEAINSIHLED